MIQAEHLYQRADLEGNCYIEATRDDTDEIQDFRLKAFSPDGTQVRELRILYNIQYDYWRSQVWKSGVLLHDSLEAGHGYGHLQYEFSLQPPKGWDEENPYPDNYEPVKPEGCLMFHWEGYRFRAYLPENMVRATMNCYIYDDLQEWRKPNLNLITDVHVATKWYEVEGLEEYAKSEQERLEKGTPDQEQIHETKLWILEEHSKDIGVTIPYDPRFID